MPHENVYGICDNKCLVKVAPKTETDAVKQRVETLEPKVSTLENQMESCVRVGDVVQGTINATGGFKGALHLKMKLTTDTTDTSLSYASCPAVSVTKSTYSGGSQSGTGTVAGYTKTAIRYPYKFSRGVYLYSEDDIDTSNYDDTVDSTKTLTFSVTSHTAQGGGGGSLYVNNVLKSTLEVGADETKTATFTVALGDTFYTTSWSNSQTTTYKVSATASINGYPTYYIIEDI